ncbi:DsbC family protein [Atopomonas sediminilitoris]|uniref:DsbC family protein n=1 Tax=Atopomonas sediminilitoris TaxID=2919919 RepID=UPI001F4E525D|nr:DsbC family protein [Atopomonas sediminilitoris]MCJ8169760.1 DsbC family protein [Atopomonas sediminilitoris]
MRLKMIAAALSLLVSSVAVAGVEDTIRQQLKASGLDLPVETVAESPLPGIYQVQLKGGRILYASADGQYVLQGYLFHFKDGQARNLTEKAEQQGIARELAKVKLSDMVVFAAKDEKAQITVFTDTDCGYCRKLHQEIPQLNRQGVSVRYLAFPRQGAQSHGYSSMVSVWCAKDRQDAMNKAKAGEDLPAAQCDNPVSAQYQLGQLIGVNGTPAIVLADGTLVPGYQPAPQLAKAALAAQQNVKQQ